MADRSRAAFGLVFALAALGMSSCGSTSTKEASATGSSALATPTQFIAQASSICQDVRTREEPLKAREESLRKLPVAAAGVAFASLAREAATISRAADERLRTLPRPRVDSQAIQQLLQAYSEEATDASSIANAAAREENSIGEAVAGALAKSIALHSALAKRLGMGGCFTLE